MLPWEFDVFKNNVNPSHKTMPTFCSSPFYRRACHRGEGERLLSLRKSRDRRCVSERLLSLRSASHRAPGHGYLPPVSLEPRAHSDSALFRATAGARRHTSHVCCQAEQWLFVDDDSPLMKPESWATRVCHRRCAWGRPEPCRRCRCSDERRRTGRGAGKGCRRSVRRWREASQGTWVGGHQTAGGGEGS